MSLKIICEQWCNSVNIVLLCSFQNSISMVVLFWKYVDHMNDARFVVNMIKNWWWQPLNCFGERRGNCTKDLLKSYSSVRNVWRNICLSCPWKGEITDWRGEAKCMMLLLQLQPRTLSIPLPCGYSLCGDFSFLVNTELMYIQAGIWWNATNTNRKWSWNTFPVRLSAFFLSFQSGVKNTAE